ncbi:hypothetical protein D3C75_1105310 [compost metagenome]
MPKDWPEVTSLLKQKIPADLIISTMEDLHAKKVADGGKVSAFSFYTAAIKERAREKKTSRMALFEKYEEGA